MKNVKTMATTSIIAALYIAVSLLIAPFAYGNIQFRLSELFNHFIVFDYKYIYGIILGVLITNFFSPLGMIDLYFGVLMSLTALLTTLLVKRWVKGIVALMIVNIFSFAFFSFIIAIELAIVLKIPFWIGWLTVALGEITVMSIGIPLVLRLQKRLQLDRQFT